MDYNCGYCGSTGPHRFFEQDGTPICDHCMAASGTCAFCVQSTQCEFESNPSPLPKQVQKTIRQGNMVIQTVVQNPERIDITCRKLCKCFSEDLGCLKQFGCCGNQEDIKPNVEMQV